MVPGGKRPGTYYSKTKKGGVLMDVKSETKMLKLQELPEDQSNFVEVEKCARVDFDRVMFDEGIVSRIEFHKHNCRREGLDDKPGLFINVYMGNVRLATGIYYSDAIIETEIMGPNKSHINIYIRAAKDYDYK